MLLGSKRELGVSGTSQAKVLGLTPPAVSISVSTIEAGFHEFPLRNTEMLRLAVHRAIGMKSSHAGNPPVRTSA